MPVFTLRSWGQTTTFEARSLEELAISIYTRTAWKWSVCVAHAADLLRGYVITEGESETVILPGEFKILERLEVGS